QGMQALAKQSMARHAERYDCFVAVAPRNDVESAATTSRIHMDEVAQQRIDLVIPFPAAEYAVMADAGLHVVDAAVGAHAGAEVLRGERLSDRADIVLLALDRHQPHALDRGRIHRAAAE